jgi:hypothetical protein
MNELRRVFLAQPDCEGGKTMRKCFLFAILMLTPVVAFGQGDTVLKQIREALLPLPEPLRDGATVVLEAVPGKRTVLRTGTNNIICRANTTAPGFNVYCYQKEMDAFWTRVAQLTLEGKSSAEILDTLSAEAKSGKLKSLTGVALYRLSGESPESSLPIMSIFVPYATSESTGLSTERNHYRPWLMWAGTAFAHVMIPGK